MFAIRPSGPGTPSRAQAREVTARTRLTGATSHLTLGEEIAASTRRPTASPSHAHLAWDGTQPRLSTDLRFADQSKVVSCDQVCVQGLGEGTLHSQQGPPLELIKQFPESLATVVKRLVEGVDFALLVNAVAMPFALGAAPPNAPAGATSCLLPASRLHQIRSRIRGTREALDWSRPQGGQCSTVTSKSLLPPSRMGISVSKTRPCVSAPRLSDMRRGPGADG